jgi:hypothetical protein
MTYVLKNLYQGMLFFLLPFYWKSASLDAPNRWFAILLSGCAVLSTLDLVFDRVLMRWRTLASLFYGVTLFACLNLVVPALFPHTRTLFTLLFAAGISVVGFSTLHLPLGDRVVPETLREREPWAPVSQNGQRCRKGCVLKGPRRRGAPRHPAPLPPRNCSGRSGRPGKEPRCRCSWCPP